MEERKWIHSQHAHSVSSDPTLAASPEGEGARPAALLPQPQEKIKKQDDSLFGLYSSHGEKAFPGSTRCQALLPALPVFGGLPLGDVEQAAQGAGDRDTREEILQGSCTLTLLCSPQHTHTAGRAISTTAHQ